MTGVIISEEAMADALAFYIRIYRGIKVDAYYTRAIRRNYAVIIKHKGVLYYVHRYGTRICGADVIAGTSPYNFFGDRKEAGNLVHKICNSSMCMVKPESGNSIVWHPKSYVVPNNIKEDTFYRATRQFLHEHEIVSDFEISIVMLNNYIKAARLVDKISSVLE